MINDRLYQLTTCSYNFRRSNQRESGQYVVPFVPQYVTRQPNLATHLKAMSAQIVNKATKRAHLRMLYQRKQGTQLSLHWIPLLTLDRWLHNVINYRKHIETITQLLLRRNIGNIETSIFARIYVRHCIDRDLSVYL